MSKNLTPQEIRRVMGVMADVAMQCFAEKESIELLARQSEFESSFGPFFMNMGASTYKESSPLWALIGKLEGHMSQIAELVKNLPDVQKNALFAMYQSRFEHGEVHE